MLPPLRIAFLLPSFPELSNTFILNQITGLIDRGHEVTLLAVARGPFDRADAVVDGYRLADRMAHIPVPGGRLQRLRSTLSLIRSPSGRSRAAVDALDVRRHGRRAWNLVQYHTAVSILRAAPLDVLHCQFGNYGPGAERVLRLGRQDAALVTSFRGADLTRTLEREPRRFADLWLGGDLFLPVSDGFRERLIGAGAPPERVVVHRSGIDLRRFPFAPRAPREGVARLLFVGRLTEKKGIVYLLEALARLVASGRDAELRIIGEGPQRAALEARCAALGLGNRVRFEGGLPHAEVVAAMQQTEALVAPSVTAADGDQEGIPNVLKEAMACGLPVVATRHSGIPELVEDGVTGLLAPERDAEALAGQLAKLLDDPSRWMALGRAGRRRVEQEYDAERLNDALVDLYRCACHRRQGRERRAGAGP